MRLHPWPLSIAVATVVLAGITAAKAADCPRQDALGTARVLSVDPKIYPRVGLKSFPQTLPLADHEVVLTFDDGPRPPHTQKVLAALAHECVRATFFLVGRSSAESPGLVKRIAAEGHTVAHHTWSHPMSSKISFEHAKKDIDRGIAADEMALRGASTTTPSTPFFRFPYFDSTPATLDFLQSRGIAVFGADLWASDWEDITPEEELKKVTERLEVAKKGIILLHDAQARTAAMMPAFLRYLHHNGYHVVHIVPAVTEKSANTH
ncbi:polysaccharide deacetylase [Bradyrhizobium iriomotense]|uniref:Chitooligosaccharide deacetylase n=2 Tax=Bradyrhizobium iriomotense TaxID=441950 RepID=A0ABQ6AX30_9BRAD|nr:polysaccharide deacetylase [Bradyrhizobium iriomotense]